MNWFTWYLFEDEVNGYLWRIGIFLLIMYMFSGIPPMGTLFYWVVMMDVLYWFCHKKPKLKRMNDDN